MHYFRDFLIKILHILQTSFFLAFPPTTNECPQQISDQSVQPFSWLYATYRYERLVLYIYINDQKKTIERKCRKIELFCISQKCAADNS